MRSPSAQRDADDPRRPLAASATWRMASMAVRVAVGVVSVSWFTRLLGMSQWGMLALFQAAVAPLALVEGFGAATVKFASEALGRRDSDDATRTVQTTVALNLAVAAAGALGLIAASGWLAGSVFAIPRAEVHRAVIGFRMVGVLWCLTLITAAYSAVLSAYQRFDLIARLGTVSFLVTTGLGLLAAAWSRSILWVLAAQCVGAAAMVAVYLRQAARLLPGVLAWPRIDGRALRRSARFWSWQLIAAGGSLCAAWCDRYVLGVFFVPTVVGYYAVAHTLQTQVYLVFLDMGEVLYPAVSALEGRGELAAAKRLTLVVGWTLTTGFGICAAATAALGGDFLHLWISPEAARATTPMLRIMCLAGMAGMAAIAPLQYVTGVGESRWNALSGVVAALIVVGLSFSLVPRYGLAGIGYGLLAAGLARWAFLGLIWRKHFAGVRLASWSAYVWSPAFISAVVALAAIAIHDRLGPSVSWGRLALETPPFLLGIAGAQLLLSELVPGAHQRRHDVTASLKPVLARILGALSNVRGGRRDERRPGPHPRA